MNTDRPTATRSLHSTPAPQGPHTQDRSPTPAGSTRAAGRSHREPAPPHLPWGPRRITAAVAATLVLLSAGTLLFEAVWVRTGHRATDWWRTVTGELASRPVDDTWIVTGAAIASALGLWLLVLALTPGRHRRLPLRLPGGDGRHARAELDRQGGVLLLRDAAMRVPGVRAVRVRVSRRRVRVRADVGFRDLAVVKEELRATVRREEQEGLLLARHPRLSIRVRPGPA